jgi:phosphoribosylamine--glycine ligase
MGLKILIIGSGGREHAISWIVSKSKRDIEKIFVMPGNAGTLTEKNVFNIECDINDHDAVLSFAIENKIDLTIVGPEVPLVKGISDLFEEKNLNIFGPKKYFSQLEGSKVFSKNFMDSNSLPTAKYKEFNDSKKAKEYLDDKKMPIVIKYDGLAAGKGVDICETIDDAKKSVDNLLKPEERIIIEDFIKGIELSAIYICNPNAHKKNLGLTWVKDYKSRDEYNSGPNTGGMGAVTHPFCSYKKNDIYSLNVEIEKILIKTIVAINNGSGTTSKYNGFMYLGLMISTNDDKPYLLEYNCRMGDPETQNIIMYLDKNEVDFLDLIGFDNSHYPDNFNLSFIDDKKYSGYCCTIVLAAKGYPENPIKDFYIDLSDLEDNDSIKIFHAGTKISNGAIRVTGGRILSVNTYSEDKKSAVDLAYNSVSKIKAYTDSNLRNQDDSLVFFRSDIGS